MARGERGGGNRPSVALRAVGIAALVVLLFVLSAGPICRVNRALHIVPYRWLARLYGPIADSPVVGRPFVWYVQDVWHG